MPSPNDYGPIDRALHYLAFCSPFAQKAFAELESDLFEQKLKGIKSQREVFITGLPRAGTTLLLELLHGTGEFSSYTYRHMPFIVAPILWQRISGGFRKEAVKRERAHGDGMDVSFDSPEAFEEVIWLTYLRDKIVRAHSINPLTVEDVNDAAADALRKSVKKLLLLKCEEAAGAQPQRYLSKNNANISRIEALLKLFPSSTVLILFRNPGDHTSSLNRTHTRFLQQHRVDNFSRNYMKWIGHYDFGENFKPINFDAWMSDRHTTDDFDISTWVRYWIAAYEYALRHRTSRLLFFDFDRLLLEPAESLRSLARHLELAQEESLINAAETLRSPTSWQLAPDNVDPEVWMCAERTHERLKAAAAGAGAGAPRWHRPV